MTDKFRAVEQFDTLNPVGKNFVIQFLTYMSHEGIARLAETGEDHEFEFKLDHFQLEKYEVKKLLNNHLFNVVGNQMRLTLLVSEIRQSVRYNDIHDTRMVRAKIPGATLKFLERLGAEMGMSQV